MICEEAFVFGKYILRENAKHKEEVLNDIIRGRNQSMNNNGRCGS